MNSKFYQALKPQLQKNKFTLVSLFQLKHIFSFMIKDGPLNKKSGFTRFSSNTERVSLSVCHKNFFKKLVMSLKALKMMKDLNKSNKTQTQEFKSYYLQLHLTSCRKLAIILAFVFGALLIKMVFSFLENLTLEFINTRARTAFFVVFKQ